MSETEFIPTTRRIWLFVLLGLILVFLFIPVLIVVPMSFSASNYLQFPPSELSLRWYSSFFNSTEWMSATRTSMIAAIGTTILATPVGVAAAVSLRNRTGMSAGMTYGYLLSTQIVPVILIGIGIFFVYSKIGIVNSLLGIILAHSTLAVPFVVATCLSGLRQFDRTQEQAAQNLGAHPFRAFWDITLPQIRIPVAAGALFAFITSLDEVVIGLFISGGDNTVLTKRMFMQLRDQLDPTIAAISSLLIAMSLVAVGFFLLSQRGEKP
ncbi:ABC transporter permease [Microvirga pakistanensis]|uniref:ABC transporter permease n=1 Tax=Microvirga pakistanensis TaxID=1682650 RepID=UPI00141B60BD|nr:ABC transporter permease [Microvirga pakistanensis]